MDKKVQKPIISLCMPESCQILSLQKRGGKNNSSFYKSFRAQHRKQEILSCVLDLEKDNNDHIYMSSSERSQNKGKKTLACTHSINIADGDLRILRQMPIIHWLEHWWIKSLFWPGAIRMYCTLSMWGEIWPSQQLQCFFIATLLQYCNQWKGGSWRKNMSPSFLTSDLFEKRGDISLVAFPRSCLESRD